MHRYSGMERALKIQRVAKLRGELPYISHSAFVAICNAAREEPLPECDRRDVRSVRDSIMNQMTPYGPLKRHISVPLVSGAVRQFATVCPFAMLWVGAQTLHFRALLNAVITRRPSTPDKPWHIVLYSDEVTPGNNLKASNHKKLQGVYWSILEFEEALCKEDFWLTITVIRSSLTDDVDGGMSSIAARLILTFFDEDGLDFRTAGVDLTEFGLGRIWLTFGVMMSDEAALHAMFSCKGAAGNKNCMLCMNIVNSKWKCAELLDAASFFKAFDTVYDERDLILHTKDTIFTICDKLETAKEHLGITAFREKQTEVGFNYSPHGIIFDRRTRRVVDPATSTCFDWPHSVLQGTFPIQMSQLELTFRALGIDLYTKLHDYMQGWAHPAQHGATTHKQVFSDDRRATMKSSKTFKASMGESLSVHAIVAHWLRCVVFSQGVLEPQCLAFMKLSEFIYLLSGATNVEGVSAAEIRACAREYLALYAAAHGPQTMIPKHHHCLHFARTLVDHGVLPQTMPLERKHKIVKSFSEAIDNTTKSWDTCVLAECTAKSLHNLDHADHLVVAKELHKPRKPPAEISAWLAANIGDFVFLYSPKATFAFAQWCKTDDVVAVTTGASWYAAIVLFHFSHGAVVHTIVGPCGFVERSSTFSKWRVQRAECTRIFTSNIVTALTHRRVGDDVTVLHPYRLR